MRWVGPSCVMLLTTLMLAGCSGGNAKADSDDFDDAPEFQEVVVTDDTGAIRGVVVDLAIVPVEGAAIRVTPGNLETTTGESGAFVFSELDPGTYFLRVNKPGFFATQQSVEVVAGIKDPKVVRILLEADITFAPFTQLQVWEGFLQCGFTVVVVGVNACGVVDDGFITYFSLSSGIPDMAQAEMIWDSTQALSPELSLGYYQGGTTNWKNIQGASPLVLPATKAEIIAGRGESATENPMRVFPPYTIPVGVAIQQDFTVYMTYFYGFIPREGWMFIVDGECGGPANCGA